MITPIPTVEKQYEHWAYPGNKCAYCDEELAVPFMWITAQVTSVGVHQNCVAAFAAKLQNELDKAR